jgi:hypothetical protein
MKKMKCCDYFPGSSPEKNLGVDLQNLCLRVDSIIIENNISIVMKGSSLKIKISNFIPILLYRIGSRLSLKQQLA